MKPDGAHVTTTLSALLSLGLPFIARRPLLGIVNNVMYSLADVPEATPYRQTLMVSGQHLATSALHHGIVPPPASSSSCALHCTVLLCSTALWCLV